MAIIYSAKLRDTEAHRLGPVDITITAHVSYGYESVQINIESGDVCARTFTTAAQARDFARELIAAAGAIDAQQVAA